MKTIRFICHPFLLISALLMLTAFSAQQVNAKEIYSWSDENGIQHFSDLPPAGYESDDMEFTTVSPEQDRLADTEDAEPAPPGETETNTLCAQHQDRLDKMLGNRNVRYVDDSGEATPLDDQEYERLILESRTYLQERCG